MARHGDEWRGSGSQWRLLLDGARDGSWNMGADEAVLAARAADDVAPTLRLYWWSRPTLSLGRFQLVSTVDLDAAREAGVDVVRRPTGGRAVLHDHELTYSVVASVRDGLPRGVAASYAVLCDALVSAYERLGVAAALTRGTRGERSSACYLQSTRADLSLGAAKLSGSAQVWRGDTCLQHGSLVLSRDARLEGRLLRLDAEATERLALGTATIEGALGREVTREQASDALREAFSERLEVRLVLGGLSPDEMQAADALARGADVAGGERGDSLTSC